MADPISSFRFAVTITTPFRSPSSRVLGFSRISPVSGEAEEIEVREGSNFDFPSKYPGRINYPPVIFERGVDGDGFLVDWWRLVSDDTRGGGPPPSYKGTIFIASILDSPIEVTRVTRLGEAIVGDNFGLTLVECWPKSLSIGPYNAGASGFLIHAVEIVHAGFTAGIRRD